MFREAYITQSEQRKQEESRIAFFDTVDVFLKKNVLTRLGTVTVGPTQVIDSAGKAPN